MTNLRDWQKKASERRVQAADKHAIPLNSLTQKFEANGFIEGSKSRDHEIDLLLQIIEKQSEAIAEIQPRCWGEAAERIRTTQAEVEKIVERLTNE
jgi:DNA-binding MarR family transcriptional regulator